MKYKYNKLRGRIIEKFGTQERFANEVGLSKQSVSYRMTGRVGFTKADIVKWSGLLDIPSEKIVEYFFA